MSSKKIAILQSDYIPWKGYFDIINRVDEFILYDDMQYTRRDWRNRNKIVTGQGVQWLTIPVEQKGKFLQKINETRILGNKWVDEHWNAIRFNYAKAAYYHLLSDEIRSIYEECRDKQLLSEVNYAFITGICNILGIKTVITRSSDYTLCEGKTERLVALVKSAGGDYYLSGPAAKDYIRPEMFDEAGIELDWMCYDGYPEYPQLTDGFVHEVTILDMIFNVGPDCKKYFMSAGTENERRGQIVSHQTE